MPVVSPPPPFTPRNAPWLKKFTEKAEVNVYVDVSGPLVFGCYLQSVGADSAALLFMRLGVDARERKTGRRLESATQLQYFMQGKKFDLVTGRWW